MSKRILVVEDQPDSRYALNGEEKIAKAAGCDDYVPKSYSPRELLGKIRQHLS